ncbi:LysR family transcriptional regulator [Kocuria sp. M1R5S2]|uniref:LysR family transcriptional regulator n=1 Tax=Kocuria rhizosphaerae TaxID=3376285 RepID=UPI00379BAFDE
MRQLTYFLAVVDHGGFTRAAEHLLIAQPSLSQTVKDLDGHRVVDTAATAEVTRAVVEALAGAPNTS